MLANILHAYPLPHDSRGWRQNSTFSEHGHVANQIKGNHKCINLVANIQPEDALPNLNLGSKGQISFFSEQGHKFKGNGAKSTMQAHILSLHTHTLNLWVWLKGKIKSERGHVAYQIKGKDVRTNIEANTLTLHTPLRGWRNGIYVLWFISFSIYKFGPGYKFNKFALFDVCFARRHIWFSEF